MIARWLPTGPSLFTFSEENTSDLPMENVTANRFDVTGLLPGCCYVVAKMFCVVARWLPAGQILFTFSEESVICVCNAKLD